MINMLLTKCRLVSVLNVVIRRNYFNSTKVNNVHNLKQNGTVSLWRKNNIRLFMKSNTSGFSKGLEKCKRSDGVQSNYALIYQTHLGNYFIAAQVTVTVFVVAAIAKILQELLKLTTGGKPPERDFIRATPAAVSTDYNFLLMWKKSLEGTKHEDLGWFGKISKKFSDQVLADDSQKLQASFNDVGDDDMENNVVAIAMISSFVIVLHVLLRRLPVRIYASPSGHCISVQMSSLVPSRRVLTDYQMGTLNPVRSRFGLKDLMFQDPKGNKYLLMNECFRQPADFDAILGKNNNSSQNKTI